MKSSLIAGKNEKGGLGNQMSPAIKHVKIYMEQKGFTEKEIEVFLKTMRIRNWKTQTGRPIQNWKQYLFEWKYILKHPTQKSKRKNT